MKAPRVFISYSHDAPEHADRVLAFASRLRQDGIDAILDQYETSPPEGWLRWMDRHICDADFVLMICTQTYYRRIMDEEKPDEGFGVAWEGNLIFQHIYDAKTKNTKFIPVLFKGGKTEHIPKPCKGVAHYRIDSPQGYEDLYRRLTDQPKTVKPMLGKLKKLPVRERSADFPAGPKVSLAKLPSTGPELFGRDDELALLDEAWKNPKTNIAGFVAWGGVGKTALVNVWLNQMQDDHFRGAERVYGWSFYSQGAREGVQVSADEFIAAALKWFGDPDPKEGSPWDKGERLAELIKEQRTLLILDGVEPMQNPPGPEEGKIKDPGLCCLLKELATNNPGLCVMTTRMEVDDLKGFVSPSVAHVSLEHLSDEAGARLLETLEVKGTPDELKQAAREFGGHALALTLLGRYLAVVHDGEVRKRDTIPRLTDEQKQGAHARRVMESYERWFKDKPELDILRIMGLFDRPAEAGAIEAVKTEPVIEGLTTELQKQSHADWQFALNRLREVKLLAPEDDNRPGSLDCHPLVREHFGEKLQKHNPKARKEAHNRLYEHYTSVAKEFPDTIAEMAPLYAAVAHGCQAGRHQETLNEVYWRRIQRGKESFNTKKLGAIGAELSVLSGFFDLPWAKPVATLNESDKSYVLNEAGFDLQALGRLAEATRPMEAGLEADIKGEDRKNAARQASNLSKLYLTMGDLPQALRYARQSIELADRSEQWEERMVNRTTLADALHQAGRVSEAEDTFREAETIQKEDQPAFPLLYSVRGYQFCDLLLSRGKYGEARKRASQTLVWATQDRPLLDIALDHLSLGRAYLLQPGHEQTGDFTQAVEHLIQAADGLRKAGTQDWLPVGLLARGELYRVQKLFDKAQKDLGEAMTIATRGGMRLHEADCHLEQARLHLAMNNKNEARKSHAKAKEMIEQMGYHRRDKEVEEVGKQLA